MSDTEHESFDQPSYQDLKGEVELLREENQSLKEKLVKYKSDLKKTIYALDRDGCICDPLECDKDPE